MKEIGITTSAIHNGPSEIIATSTISTHGRQLSKTETVQARMFLPPQNRKARRRAASLQRKNKDLR